MNDAYVEWMVKQKPPVYGILVKALLVVLGVASIFAAMLVPFGFLFPLLAVGAIYFVFPMFSLEFEYLVVNDQIRVDKIMGQRRRKKVWEGTLNDVEIIAPVDSYMLKDLEKPGMKVRDFSSKEPGRKVYGIIQQTADATTEILIEPNEKIIKQLWLRAPRKVFQ